MSNDDNMRMFEWNDEDRNSSDWRSGFSSTEKARTPESEDSRNRVNTGGRSGMPDFKWDSVNRSSKSKSRGASSESGRSVYGNDRILREDPSLRRERYEEEKVEEEASDLIRYSKDELEELKGKKGEIIESTEEGFIEFRAVTKNYTMGEMEIRALDGINFKIQKGEIVIVVGASGAGKSTILNIMGGMDRQSSGEIIVDGEKISSYTDKQMVMYRRYDVGFVFQFYNLVPNLTAKENVELATQISKFPLDVDQTMVAVGLEDRMNNFPSQLSGGEQQRVAIARALAKNPKLLLCDEPTGALDYNTGKAILKLLQDTARINGMTVIIITHNYALTGIGDRVIKVKNGKIEAIETNRHPMDIADVEW